MASLPFLDAASVAPNAKLSQADKLVLLALASSATERARVRIDPVTVATKTGLSVAKVEGALASLHRTGHIDARRWEDSGCWSARMTVAEVHR